MSNDLHNAMQAHRTLVAQLREAYPDADDQTLADTAEGETSLDLAIAAVLREAVEADAMARGLGEVLKQSQDRKRRLEAKADKLRSLALAAAEESGIKSIRVPDMTAAVMHSKQAVVITDENAIPAPLVEIKLYPSKDLIGEILRGGYPVEGAFLGNSHSYWMVRRG